MRQKIRSYLSLHILNIAQLLNSNENSEEDTVLD
jgi:hypothetical protein